MAWLFVASTVLGGIVHGPATAEAADPVIRGQAFLDTNGDGVRQPTESALEGERVYLWDEGGDYLDNRLTDAEGRYAFEGLQAGSYGVSYGQPDWWELWEEWAPSTTGSVRPRHEVDLAEPTTADFGWRPIVRSTDPDEPISAYTGPSGLRIESFNDVVSARDVHDAVMAGTLHGDERASTVIRFDIGTRDFCSSAIVEGDGEIQSFSTACSITYLRWLDTGDPILFHEYGHAWGVYHARVVQQDPELLGYLQARGIDPADSRLGSSHAWSRYEILAEDYRQLFGSPTAQQRGQENQDIPPATEVPGLAEYLATTFMEPPATDDPTSDTTADDETTPDVVHVADLDGRAHKDGRSWTATTRVLVVDATGDPVANTRVEADWLSGRDGRGTVTCQTDGSGVCEVTVTLANRASEVTFTLTDLEREGMVYDPSANTDAEADSDGTSISVTRP